MKRHEILKMSEGQSCSTMSYLGYHAPEKYHTSRNYWGCNFGKYLQSPVWYWCKFIQFCFVQKAIEIRGGLGSSIHLTMWAFNVRETERRQNELPNSYFWERILVRTTELQFPPLWQTTLWSSVICYRLQFFLLPHVMSFCQHIGCK